VQRDLKIGISLCVLMFGVVGALMFRREQPASISQGLQLKTAKQLDRKIAQRSRTPYMTGEIEHEDEMSPYDQDPQDGTRPAHLLPPNHLLEDDDGFLAPHDGRRTDSGSGISSVESRRETTPRIVTEDVTPGLQKHTIQTGDTLSSLAEKYLGSQRRFQEIFDANRTVLANPDRLPEGIEILIPPAVKEIRRVPEAKSTTSQVGREAPLKHETLRPTHDLSLIEPIAPTRPHIENHPNALATDSNHPDPERPGNVEVKPETTKVGEEAAEANTIETRKRFQAPTRLPFSNHLNQRTHPARKVRESSADSSDSSSVDPAHNSAQPQTYQVRRGDSLERISQKVYGNSKRAADIFNANRSKLSSPDAVREGLELDLP